MQHETEREREERLKKTYQRIGSQGRNLLSSQNDLNIKEEKCLTGQMKTVA